MITPTLTRQLLCRPAECEALALSSLHQTVESIESKLAAGVDVKELFDWLDNFYPQRQKIRIDENDIAHIHLNGFLAQGMTEIEKKLGTTDLYDFRADLEQAAKLAKGVYLYGYSPGGVVTGGIEAAEHVKSLSKKMPVYAFSDEGFFSLGYKIVCGATKIWSTKSAEWGSIGTIINWVDRFEAWASRGLYADPITNKGADLKSTGYRPRLLDNEREFLESSADYNGESFKAWVSKNRTVKDPENTFRGQWFDAPIALEVGLIDYIGKAQDCYDSLRGQVLRGGRS